MTEEQRVLQILTWLRDYPTTKNMVLALLPVVGGKHKAASIAMEPMAIEMLDNQTVRIPRALARLWKIPAGSISNHPRQTIKPLTRDGKHFCIMPADKLAYVSRKGPRRKGAN